MKSSKKIFVFILLLCFCFLGYQFMLVGSEGSLAYFINYANDCFEKGNIVLCDKNGETVNNDELAYFCNLYNNQEYSKMKEYLLDKGYSFGNQ